MVANPSHQKQFPSHSLAEFTASRTGVTFGHCSDVDALTSVTPDGDLHPVAPGFRFPAKSEDAWDSRFSTIAALAAGNPVHFAEGTHLCATVDKFTPSNSRWIGYGATIRNTITFAPSMHFGSAFNGEGTQVQEGTLSGVPTVGSRTAVVAMSAAPTVGNYLQIHYGALDYMSGENCRIVAVSGSSSPWTVTLHEPIGTLHNSDDAVFEYSAITEHVQVEGFKFTGAGSQAVEWINGCRHIHLSDCHYDGSTVDGGNRAAFAFDGFCRHSVYERCSANMLLAAGTNGYPGFYLQTTEGCVIRDCATLHAGTAGRGDGAFQIYDTLRSGVESSFAYDSETGFALKRFEAGTLGCFYSWIVNSGALGCDTSFSVTDSIGSVLANISAVSERTKAYGISIGTSTDTLVMHARIVGHQSGVASNPGSGKVVRVSDSSFRDSRYYGAYLLSGHTSLRGDVIAGNADTLSAVYCAAGSVTIDDCDLSTQVSGGYGTVRCSGTRHTIRNSRIAQAGTGGSSALYIDAGVTYIDNTVLTGAVGVVLTGNASLRIGPNVDLTGCTTPISQAGGFLSRQTVTLNGTNAVVCYFDDLRADPFDPIRLSLSSFGSTRSAAPPKYTKVTSGNPAAAYGSVDITGLTYPGDFGTKTVHIIVNGADRLVTFASPANAAAVVSQINATTGLSGVASLSGGQYLVLTSPTTGKGSTIQVVDGTLAATTIGHVSYRCVSGNYVYFESATPSANDVFQLEIG